MRFKAGRARIYYYTGLHDDMTHEVALWRAVSRTLLLRPKKYRRTYLKNKNKTHKVEPNHLEHSQTALLESKTLWLHLIIYSQSTCYLISLQNSSELE